MKTIIQPLSNHSKEEKNGNSLISFPMTVRESYLLGLMINACQKHSNNCECLPCKVEKWALINLQNIGSD